MNFDNPLVNQDSLAALNQALSDHAKKHQNQGAAIENAVAQSTRNVVNDENNIGVTMQPQIEEFALAEMEVNQALKAELEKELLKKQQLEEQIRGTYGMERTASPYQGSNPSQSTESSEGLENAAAIGTVLGAIGGSTLYANREHSQGLKKEMQEALSGISNKELRDIMHSKYNKDALKEVVSPLKNIKYTLEKKQLLPLAVSGMVGGGIGSILAQGMYGANELRKEINN